jgi:hypothetical protein
LNFRGVKKIHGGRERNLLMLSLSLGSLYGPFIEGAIKLENFTSYPQFVFILYKTFKIPKSPLIFFKFNKTLPPHIQEIPVNLNLKFPKYFLSFEKHKISRI